MAITVVSQGSPSLPQTTFLERCVQELDMSKIETMERHSKMWKIASVVALLGFCAIALAVFVLTGIYAAPIYLSFAALAVLTSLPGGLNLYHKLERTASALADQAEKMRTVSKSYAQLSQNPSLGSLIQRTEEMGIPWVITPEMIRNPESLTQMTPLIARVKYWTDEMNEALESVQTSKEKLEKNDPSISRFSAFFEEQRATSAKVKAAFVTAILQRPTFVGTEKDLFALKDDLESALQRVFGNAIGEQNADTYLTFKNGSVAPITYAEAKQMSIPDIARRIVTAMAA